MISSKLNKIIENYLLNNKNKVKINSNDVLKGDVFIALQGTETHGNNYIEQAIDKGAKFIVTDKKLNLIAEEKQILLVNDTLFFLLTIANKKRNIFKGKVIGITGSVGKTSIKENLKYFLSLEFDVSASFKSYNNYLGVLISIINMNLNSDFAIFEIGTNNFYEIRHLTSIIMPQQVIITNIFPTHLENFKHTRNIAKEKLDIFNPKFNPNVELLILSNSNKDELFLYKQAKKINISKILTLGENENSDYCIQNFNEKANNLSIARVKYNGKLFEILVKTNSYHIIYNIVICLMIFNYNNLSLNKFYKLAKYLPKIAGRGLEKMITFNNKEVLFIDESYNASPVTMKNCIDYFYKLELQKNQNKFIILGDMNELGEKSKFYHQNIIELILEYGFKNVILCGEIFKSVMNGMKINEENIKQMENENEIVQHLKKNIHNNDIILIKGSNSTKVNKLANLLNQNRE